jgi:hypothetical protein
MTNETLRTYGRMELALMYNPKLSSGHAWRKLKYWIEHNKALADALAQSGYNRSHRHSFTPKEVALIFEYLGEP